MLFRKCWNFWRAKKVTVDTKCRSQITRNFYVFITFYFLFFFSIQDKKCSKPNGKAANIASDNEIMNQCTPLFTKKQEQNSKNQNRREKWTVQQQRRQQATKRWWRIPLCNRLYNVKDRGQFWLLHCLGSCRFVHHAGNIVVVAHRSIHDTASAAASCPVIIIKTGRISSPGYIINAFCVLFYRSFRVRMRRIAFLPFSARATKSCADN